MVVCHTLPGLSGKLLTDYVCILEMGGDFALHPLLRLPDQCSEVLDVGLASHEESWESKDQKDLSCVPSPLLRDPSWNSVSQTPVSSPTLPQCICSVLFI